MPSIRLCVLLLLQMVGLSRQQGSRTFFYSDANDENFAVTTTHANLMYVNKDMFRASSN